MEPQSGYYDDPVIVLDFQSLYPSIIIAYNYWYRYFSATISNQSYSTCIGRPVADQTYGIGFQKNSILDEPDWCNRSDDTFRK